MFPLKRFSGLTYFIFFLCVLLLLPGVRVRYASAKVSSFNSEDYEDLTVDNYSSVPDSCYAKFNSSTKNQDYYTLYLEEDSDDYDNFVAAVSTLTGITDPYAMCFKPTLMFYDEDKDDADDVQKYNAVTLYVPIPDDYQANPEKVYLYEVSAKGSKYQASIYSNGTLWQDEFDIYYTCITLSNSTSYSHIYGYAYDENAEDEDDDDEDYDDEEDDNEDDEDDDDDDEDYDIDDEDDDDGDDIDDEDDIDEDDIDDDADDDASSATPTPTATPKATATPTPRPKVTSTPTPTSSGSSSSGSSTSGSSGSSAKKDSIPKTGDDFPLGLLSLTAAVAASGLLYAVIALKKRK